MLTAVPHSNYRAELAVDTTKNLLAKNVGPNVSNQVNKFRRAMIQYNNFTDQQCNVSPARALFVKALRYFTPHNSTKYKPATPGV